MICPRVTYMWANLLLAFSAHLEPACKWCFDGTTFEITAAGNGGYVMIYTGDEDDTPIRTTLHQSHLAVYAKWMYMGSAAGEIAPLFLVFAVETLADDEYYIHEVVGLSSGSDVTRSGFVAFCKSRAGNAKLWAAYFKDFVIPTLVTSQKVHKTKVCF